MLEVLDLPLAPNLIYAPRDLHRGGPDRQIKNTCVGQYSGQGTYYLGVHSMANATLEAAPYIRRPGVPV